MISSQQSHSSERRENYAHFHSVELRWNDLDAYRHVNNARFYAFYDTAIMHYLTVGGGFDLLDGEVVPFTVENLCRFHKSLQFPSVIACGLRVGRLGTSSVRYELALFAGEDPEVSATGYFIDVFVDRDTDKPCAIPAAIRAHLENIVR